jgi:hypothetical protein
MLASLTLHFYTESLLTCWSLIGLLAELRGHGLLIFSWKPWCCDEERSMFWELVVCAEDLKRAVERQRKRESCLTIGG